MAESKEMNVDTLDKIRQVELMQKQQRNRMLTKIDANFYAQLRDYLNELEREYEKECGLNPESSKARILSDDLSRTKMLAEDIYELREEKIVFAALSSVKGGKPDLSNLVKEERELYKSLVDILSRHREMIFQMRSEKEESEKIEGSKEYIVVRILEDLPQFVGTDERTYSLSKEDIVTLPKVIGELLVKRGVAESIDD